MNNNIIRLIAKKMKAWSVFFAALMLIACTGTDQNQRQLFLEWMMPPPIISELGPSTLMIQSENGNLLAFIGKEHLFVVNTMMDETLWSVLRKKTGKTVSHLVLTGSYWEQVNGLRFLKTPIEVFLSKQAYDTLKAEQPDLWKAIHHHHFHQIHQNTKIFFEKKRIALYPLNAAQSEGNMAFYLPDEQILYTGMLYFEKEHAFFATQHGSLKEWIGALDQLAQIETKAIIPGRGKLSKKQDMISFREYLNTVSQYVSEAFSKQLSHDEMLRQAKQPAIEQRERIPFLANKQHFLSQVYAQMQIVQRPREQLLSAPP